jgi:tetratricopeptide (TPR) repeat protein
MKKVLSRLCRPRIPRRAVLICCAVFFPVVALPQNQALEQQARSGKQALAAKAYDQAFQAFDEGRVAAQAAGDRKWEADFLFYMGLVRQQQSAEPGGAPDAVRPTQQEAAGWYRRMLDLRPDSGAALNNLAQVYSELGQKEEAAKLLENAVALRDSREAFYSLNLADLLSSTGDPKRAIDYYKRALKEYPEDTRAHLSLVKAYVALNTPDLLPYLWALVEKGLVMRAQESALSALPAVKWRAREKEELLAVVVVSLGKQFYDPSQFPKTEAASSLAKLARDEAVGGGAAEILNLHQLRGPNPSAFPWWARRGDPYQEPPRGVWPRDGFRMLIRSLGAWHQQAGNARQAEAYYLLAVGLVPEQPDPEAVLQLADLYSAGKDLLRLEAMTEQYATALFLGKKLAYRGSHLEKIYKYHRALGVVYAHLGRWGSGATPTSAIFQLEHAQSIAEQFNQQAVQQGRTERLSVEPRMLKLLADGYDANKMSRAASRTRLELAERYEKEGDTQAARAALKTIEEKGSVRGFSTFDKQRYSELMRRLPR